MDTAHTKKQDIVIALLAVLALIAVGFVLRVAQVVVLPLVIAWLLSYLLSPAVVFAARHRLPVSLAVLIVLVLVIALCYGIGVFLYARTADLVAQYWMYEDKLSVIADAVSERFQIDWSKLAALDWNRQVSGYLVSLSGSLVSFVSNLLLVGIFLVFILLGHAGFGATLRTAFARERADKILLVLDSIAADIRQYLAIQFVLSLVTGVLVWLALWAIGVQFAVTWGALTFLLNFIPTIGSIIAALPPVLIAFVQFYPNPWPGVVSLAAIMIVQNVLANVVGPKVMGDKLNLSPIVVLLSLVFWGWLWGAVGAILSVPIASAIKVVCANIEPLHPVSTLMGSHKGTRK